MINNKYTCIVIDDEPKAIELLRDSIEELYDNIEVAGTHTNWKTALHDIKLNHYDIVFLDISMPQKNGMDLLALAPEMKSEVIFVTAHSEHAVDAFGFGAAGYILKPINDTLLYKTVNKAIERIDNKRAAENSQPVASAKARIGIPSQKGIDYVDINDILYLEAVNRYTCVVKSDEKLLSSYSIGKYRPLLDGHSFCQVHRSYIINLQYVKRYEHPGAVYMTNGMMIPVSRQHKDDFHRMFNERG
ncbi:MAG: response regulator transcription factor [Flavipsychrobacter sp.]|jgi:two-component system LytT family response regulator|nr:response regulator transcription factor [Flavipsychrobacter sp.]